jgi:hypothetical protein
MKKGVHEMEFEIADWMKLTRVRGQWRSVLYTVMTLEFHKMWGADLLVSEGLLSF